MADEEMVNGTQQSSLTQEKKGTPRLMITEMVLENFKSYAGVQRVGPFHKVCGQYTPLTFSRRTRTKEKNRLSFFQSFSSVVGPNGSGKSNVIDAMLFVFGKRAKQVRWRLQNHVFDSFLIFRKTKLTFILWNWWLAASAEQSVGPHPQLH